MAEVATAAAGLGLPGTYVLPAAALLAALSTAAVAFLAIRGAVGFTGVRGRRRSVEADPRKRWLSRAIVRLTRRSAPRLVARAGRRDMRALIVRAGLDGRVETGDIAALRVLSTLIALLALPQLAATLPHRLLPLALAVWLAAAAETPVWWLRRAASARARALRAALPDALELMRACLTAGLPLRRALILVGDHCAEPVAGEFLCVAAETGLGISQATALDGLVARNPLPELRALVSAMRQADRHGSPLAPVIAAQAEEARRARDRAIVERGARAGPKIQLIVAATIVPAALIGFAAVVIAAFTRGDLRFI